MAINSSSQKPFKKSLVLANKDPPWDNWFKSRWNLMHPKRKRRMHHRLKGRPKIPNPFFSDGACTTPSPCIECASFVIAIYFPRINSNPWIASLNLPPNQRLWGLFFDINLPKRGAPDKPSNFRRRHFPTRTTATNHSFFTSIGQIPFALSMAKEIKFQD